MGSSWRGRQGGGGGGGGGIRFYTIIERVQSESRGKVPAKNESDALRIEFLNFSIGSDPRFQQLQ